LIREEASSVSLSMDQTHFVQTVSNCRTILTLFFCLEMRTTSMVESQMWVNFCQAFIKSVMNYAIFPYMSVPLTEAATRLMTTFPFPTTRH